MRAILIPIIFTDKRGILTWYPPLTAEDQNYSLETTRGIMSFARGILS